VTLPPITDPRWFAVVTRRVKHEFEFLALNLVLTGTALSLQRDPGPSNLDQAVLRVRTLLERNAHLKSVQRDLALIFGGER
jgi:hypothetical protein